MSLFADFRRLTENSPESLKSIAIKKIINDSIELKSVFLPHEISNDIIESYREILLNSKEELKRCDRFLYQFQAKNCRLTQVNLSDLPVGDKCLRNLILEHSKSLTHLNINNCNDLTSNIMTDMNQILTRVEDVSQIRRTVTFSETNIETGEEKVTIKSYENGILRTSTYDDMNHEQMIGLAQDDLSLLDAMGAFEDRDLAGFREQKLNQLKERQDTKLSSSMANYRGSGQIFSPDHCAPSVTDSPHHQLIIPPEILETEEFTFSNGVMRKHLKIQSYQKSPLQVLIIGKSTHILPSDHLDQDVDIDKQLINPHLNLRKLVIHDWSTGSDIKYANPLKFILTPGMAESLQYLDLSNCSGIGDGSPLIELKALTSLILFNVPKLHQAIINISKLSNLRALDISTTSDRYGHGYKHPDDQLQLLSLGLVHLTHLDISGTNLAGPRADHIRGLASRYSRPFDFLGLYNMTNEAAYRQNLPATKIAGDATEEQILTACEAYIDRVDCLKRILNDLFHCFRFETNFHDVNRALDVVLVAMSRHVTEKQIQIAASASLFYIVKSEDSRHNSNMKIRRMIISRLLDAMHAHRYDPTMLRNGSLTLIHFKIPNDVIFEYQRLVDILLHIVSSDEDEFIQRLGIYLLNSLACQVDGDQKILVGDLGAISKMLGLIETRLQRGVCDEVMETAWSTMWNITDETPLNCERFLDNRGMDFFLRCMNTFPNNAELLRNMMGLLGNVAECQTLRHRLMKQEFMEKFSDLLLSESDGIEVSYNAAGILSHILSDGKEFWLRHLSQEIRDTVMDRMKNSISKWRINSKRNINYRSFEPILRLLKVDDELTQAQHWAVFALANLTRVYSSKYCPLLKEDGGDLILQKLLLRSDVPDEIRTLAVITMKQFRM